MQKTSCTQIKPREMTWIAFVIVALIVAYSAWISIKNTTDHNNPAL